MVDDVAARGAPPPAEGDETSAALAREVRRLTSRLSEQTRIAAHGARAVELEARIAELEAVAARVPALESANARLVLDCERQAAAIATVSVRASEAHRLLVLAAEEKRCAELRAERALFAQGTLREILVRECAVVTAAMLKLDALVATREREREDWEDALNASNELVARVRSEQAEKQEADFAQEREKALKLVSDAEREAGLLVTKAKSDAGEISASAQAIAANALKESKNEAAGVVKEAKKEASVILKEAKAECSHVLKKARADAKLIREKKVEIEESRAARALGRTESRLALATQEIEALRSEVEAFRERARTAEEIALRPSTHVGQSALEKAGLGGTFSPTPLAKSTILGRPAGDLLPPADIASESRSRFTTTLPYDAGQSKAQSPLVAALDFSPDFQKDEVRGDHGKGRQRKNLQERGRGAGRSAVPDMHVNGGSAFSKSPRPRKRTKRRRTDQESDWETPSSSGGADEGDTTESDGSDLYVPARHAKPTNRTAARATDAKPNAGVGSQRTKRKPATPKSMASPHLGRRHKQRGDSNAEAVDSDDDELIEDDEEFLRQSPRRARSRKSAAPSEAVPEGEEAAEDSHDGAQTLAHRVHPMSDSRPPKKRSQADISLGALPSQRASRGGRKAMKKGSVGKRSLHDDKGNAESGGRRGMRKRKRISYDYSVAKGLDVNFEFAR